MNQNPFPNVPVQAMNSMPYIRILHASPDAPAVDVYANNQLIAHRLAYKQFTDYIPVTPGSYTIQVFPAGQRMNPVINTDITVPPSSAFTVAAVGELANIGLLPIPEVYMPNVPMNDQTYVRFVHLSPNAPAVDVTLPDGTMAFQNVAYKNYTNYGVTDPGSYTFQVKPTGTDQTVLTISDVNLKPGTIYSVYAVGLVGKQPPLEAILSTDMGLAQK